MFRQNPNHTGVSPYNTSLNLGKLKWSFTTNSDVFSSPAISSDGTIYVGSFDSKLYAINPDGTEKWNFTTGSIVRSSPAIGSDGTIYVGSDDFKLYAINPDGTEKWNFTTGSKVYSSPAIGSDGTIYVGSFDNKLYAINPDGTEKWSYATGKGIFSSPAIGFDGTIYVGSHDGNLYAINPNGTRKWSYTTRYSVFSSPAIDSDGNIYVGSYWKLYAINPDGTEKWSFTTGSSVYSSPAIGSDGTIYVGSHDSRLYAINPDGTKKWSFKAGSDVCSSPAIGSDGTIYVGSWDYKLYAIKPDGTKKWHFTTGDWVYSSPAIGSDGTIYVGSDDHKLYAIGPPPSLNVQVTSHFSELNSAAQSAITVHVTDGTNPVQGATVNLDSDNRGIFSSQSGITDANGYFKSIFNAPTVITQIICKITAQASKTGYNDGSGYVDVTINPIPWPMFRQNLNHTGLSPYDTSANTGKLKWSFMTDDMVLHSPAIGVDGTIYVGSFDNKLYAINPDGSEKWNFTTGYTVYSSPVLGNDGTIYIGSWDNKLYAINPNGTQKWNFTTGDRVRSSPAIGSDGTIYIGSNDYVFYAINPDGTEKWSFTTGKYIVSSPAIGHDGTIYIGSRDNKLYAINPDGTEKWNFITGDCINPSPAIDFDGTIYVGSNDYKLYAINPDGTEKWSFTTGGTVYSSPAIGSDGIIYVGSLDHKLYSIYPNGTERWSYTTGWGVYSSPAIGSDGIVYVGSHDGKLYAIYPNGSERWNFTTGGIVRSSPAIDIDGTIYIGSGDHKLYAIGKGGTPPIAIAGPDQTVNEGDIVQFDASTSYDPDGSIETYEWDFDPTDGLWWETSAVPDATSPTPTHTYGDDGVFIVTLRVTDDNGMIDSDTCNVTVINLAPTIRTIIAQNATKDSQNGTEEWVARYNGPGFGDDVPESIAVDTLGNVYVTGWSYSTYSPNNSNYTTIKYDQNGNELWVATYNGPGNSIDCANDIAVDSLGNVYVTGKSKNSKGDYDYATIKYDTKGNELWVARSNPPGTGDNHARAIAIDTSGNIYVTGYNGNGYATIKYDLYGNRIWIAIYDEGMASDIAVDSSGNVYVTGSCYGGVIKSDFATVAYNSAGNELWVARYNGPGNSWDSAYDITLDSSRNVYVTGSSYGNGTSADYATVKYDSSGNELWVARYNGLANEADYPQDIAIDSSGNVYVFGRSRGCWTEDDYATVAYDHEGNELWVARYNGPGNSSESGHALAINDLLGIIYVTGQSHGDGTDGDYATVAYDVSGNELWVARYNGPGNKYDSSYDVAVDSSGNIFITGYSRANKTGRDYCTIKYSTLSYYECNEGSTMTFTATTIDLGSDDITFTWNWGDGTPDTIITYYNDGSNPEPVYNPATNEIKSPWGTYPFSATDIVSHTYGDDGVFNLTLTVEDDDGGICVYKTNITVLNVNPTVTIESITMDVEIGLRVAGRKYNNVSMTLYENGNPIGNVSIERMPGSPNEQIAWIPVSINFSKSYSAIVTFTPEDPPNVGANPVWIYIKPKDGSIKKIHHTFNVQQSKKRDSDHWNHVEPWEVDLNTHFIGLPFEITSHITDPGSDDETLTFTYGSQVKTVTYLNNPPNPDPFPSPDVKPMDIIVTTTLVYEGAGTVTLLVEDDDSGAAIASIDLV